MKRIRRLLTWRRWTLTTYLRMWVSDTAVCTVLQACCLVLPGSCNLAVCRPELPVTWRQQGYKVSCLRT